MPHIDVAEMEMEADVIEEKGQRAVMVDKLAHYYHSDFVKHNMPWIRNIPFRDWLGRQLMVHGMTLND